MSPVICCWDFPFSNIAPVPASAESPHPSLNRLFYLEKGNAGWPKIKPSWTCSLCYPKSWNNLYINDGPMGTCGMCGMSWNLLSTKLTCVPIWAYRAVMPGENDPISWDCGEDLPAAKRLEANDIASSTSVFVHLHRFAWETNAHQVSFLTA